MVARCTYANALASGACTVSGPDSRRACPDGQFGRQKKVSPPTILTLVYSNPPMYSRPSGDSTVDYGVSALTVPSSIDGPPSQAIRAVRLSLRAWGTVGREEAL